MEKEDAEKIGTLAIQDSPEDWAGRHPVEVGYELAALYPDEVDNFLEAANEILFGAMVGPNDVSFNGGRLHKWWVGGKLDAQTELIGKAVNRNQAVQRLADEYTAAWKNAAGRAQVKSEFAWTVEQAAAQREVMRLQHQIQVQLIKDAAIAGIDPLRYLEINAQGYDEKVKAESKERLNKIDREHEEKIRQEKIAAAISYRLAENQEIYDLTEKLLDLHVKLYEIESSKQPEVVKQNLKTIRQEQIDSLQLQIRGRSDRLVQAICGGLRGEGNAPTDDGGDVRSTVKED